jgi:glycolate oxidase iron-sulfur subunit
MDICEYYDEIAQCNRCGFCQVACPIFRSTGHESGVARGRLALLRAVIEGRLDWTREIEEPLFDCLLCGACTANCFPAIPTSELVIKARSEYLQKVGRKSIHRLLFDHLLPYPRRLHLAARAVALGKNSGMSNLARALGLLRIFGHDFSNAEEIIERIPPRPFREKNKPGSYAGDGKTLRSAYFVGCGVDIISQDAGSSTFELLKKTSKTVDILENCCCGLPAWSYGDLTVARKLAKRNIQILASGQYDVIITDCSSCASFLKQYPQIISGNDAQHAAAENLAGKVQDLVQWLFSAEFGAMSASQALTVTYHDPCHASRGQGLNREPREILKRLPGLVYREMPEADWCCGGAGSYALSHYDLSRKVLDRKIRNLEATGADLLVTSCPACIIQLSYGVRKHGLKTRVCHISQIVKDYD